MTSTTLFKLDLSKYGGSLVVTQGFNDPDVTHKGYMYNSLDFQLPAGSKVYAFFSGTVRDIRESVADGSEYSTAKHYPDDLSNGTSDIGNYITIQSGDKWITYQHLKQNSVIPLDERSVNTSDLIGTVGNTGYRQGSHLHVTFGSAEAIFKTGLQVADGRSDITRAVFETATAEIIPGVVSQVSYDLQAKKGLAADQHNLTLIGTLNIDGQGDSYDNIISGSLGKNMLYGRNGNDTLYGGDGNDNLLGGAGQDKLSGGTGADIFRYDSVKDSAPGASNHDFIIDFSRSEGDRIDVSAIDFNTNKSGGQNPIFIGNQSFHRVAGELRLFDGLLQADTDGNGKADWEVQITGMSNLKSSDWIFD